MRLWAVVSMVLVGCAVNEPIPSTWIGDMHCEDDGEVDDYVGVLVEIEGDEEPLQVRVSTAEGDETAFECSWVDDLLTCDENDEAEVLGFALNEEHTEGRIYLFLDQGFCTGTFEPFEDLAG